MYYIYIISNRSLSPLYVGVTSNLEKRIWEHKNKIHVESYSAIYNLNKLLYWEQTENITSAIAREKQLKNWHKEWKLNLIKTKNPHFADLSIFTAYAYPESGTG
ncbi:MAG: GIY-YIG nuclease family protein [Ignavibacteria bacterium]|nr:GIY-YIG nuclease family protein [Ignavibacteria bacterium]